MRAAETRRLRLVWQLDPNAAEIWERDWLGLLLDAFDVEPIVDRKHETVLPASIVVTDGSSREGVDVESYLKRYRAAGHRVGVIHLSDEHARSPLSFYPHAAFVFRNYWRPEALRDPHCRYFALGWKSGFTRDLAVRDIEVRRYTWSFAGQVKTSRETMLEAARRIPGGYTHLNQRFHDPQALDVRAYADLMNDTVFALCPRGFTSVDCFRVYEALEAGAIPIVEDDGGLGYWRDLLSPAGLLRVGAWRRSYWSRNRRRALAGSYWLRAYGREFPCPRIHHWENLPRLLDRIDVLATAKSVRSWWARYKRELRQRVAESVEQTLLRAMP